MLACVRDVPAFYANSIMLCLSFCVRAHVDGQQLIR
jgi:hypothetical protein